MITANLSATGVFHARFLRFALIFLVIVSPCLAQKARAVLNFEYGTVKSNARFLVPIRMWAGISDMLVQAGGGRKYSVIRRNALDKVLGEQIFQ
jgi:hypothetical protein